MFHNISPLILDRMHAMEAADASDRVDGTPKDRRLRQVPPETGRFLALLARMAPEGDMVEIGTSGGYSTLWLSLAAREVGRKVKTFEILANKAATARETFEVAGVQGLIELVQGDAREHLAGVSDIGFCFLDAEKEDYAAFYDLVVPKLVAGGILAADNVLSHSETLGAVVAAAQQDSRVDAIVVPIGKGVLVARKRQPQ